MKRISLVLAALVVLFGLSGCDVLGGSSGGGGGGTSYTFPSGGDGAGAQSTWWLKGSFDGWTEQGSGDDSATGAATHFFHADSLNPNLLSFSMTAASPGLRLTPYQFVVMGPETNTTTHARPKFDFVYSVSTTSFADNGVYTLTVDNGTTSSNILFSATASSYTVLMDVTVPSAPVIKLVPGSTVASPYTFAELSAGLAMGGTINAWTETAGTVDATAKTVTWTGLTSAAKSADFYFHGNFGYVNGDDSVVYASGTQGASVNLPIGTNGKNFHLGRIPKADSVWTITVTINPAGTSQATLFSVSVTTSTLGTTAWTPTPAWTNLYLAGAGAEFGSWTAGSFISVPLTAGVGTIQVTASSTAEQFKIVQANAWGTEVGFSGIEQATGSLPLSSNGGNIGFTAVSGTTYTITVDFTTANYVNWGVPSVKVVTP